MGWILGQGIVHNVLVKVAGRHNVKFGDTGTVLKCDPHLGLDARHIY